MGITGPMMRRLIESWHGVRLSEDRAAALAQIDSALARSMTPAVDGLIIEDQPSRFRRLLVSAGEGKA